MAREVTADFAKLVAQSAIGQGLRSHYPISDELPSLFHSLIARLDETDAQRTAKRYPSKLTVAQNRAAPISADAYSGTDLADRLGTLPDLQQRRT
jgi:hypothetical protein